ncbi:MAG: LLM class flavin-dependent oxidoreductase [Actinomycetota bacterium]
MTADRELFWFGALCDDDYEFLGDPSSLVPSDPTHCLDIVTRAERAGFDGVLLPSGYTLGIDATAFTALAARATSRLALLLAERMGETWPPQLARRLATLDHLAGGRLLCNVISSELPGETIDSGARYRRTVEAVTIVRDLLDGRPVEHRGEFFDLAVDPPRLGTVTGRAPSFYFGGFSDDARDAAAEIADVYLMWPDTEDVLRDVITDVTARAADRGRTLRFGYRIHTVVRDTDSEARAAADRLVSRLDDTVGAEIRARSLDATSVGVRRQAELREAGEWYEDCVWTGVGRARSGCGAALVGSPATVSAKLDRLNRLGIGTFILSGYPHAPEADRVGALLGLPGRR